MKKIPFGFIRLMIVALLMADVLYKAFGHTESSSLHNIYLLIIITLISIYAVSAHNKKIACLFPVVSGIAVYWAAMFYCLKVYDFSNPTLIPFGNLFYLNSYILYVGTICSVVVAIYYSIKKVPTKNN